MVAIPYDMNLYDGVQFFFFVLTREKEILSTLKNGGVDDNGGLFPLNFFLSGM